MLDVRTRLTECVIRRTGQVIIFIDSHVLRVGRLFCVTDITTIVAYSASCHEVDIYDDSGTTREGT